MALEPAAPAAAPIAKPSVPLTLALYPIAIVLPKPAPIEALYPITTA